MPIEVRHARPGEGRRFEEIRIAGWRAGYAGMLKASLLDALEVTDERVDQWESLIRDAPGSGTLLLAEDDGAAIGGAVVLPSRDDDLPDAAELAALYVDPCAWRRGAGSALLAEGFERMPHPVQLLWVLARNEGARRFYERHGFVVDGAFKLVDRGGEQVEVRYLRTRLD